MSNKVEESYGAVALAADVDQAVTGATGAAIAGYLCTTAGSIKLSEGVAGAGATIVNTIAVVAGTFYCVPLAVTPGTVVFCTQTGGAAGTWFVTNH